MENYPLLDSPDRRTKKRGRPQNNVRAGEDSNRDEYLHTKVGVRAPIWWRFVGAYENEAVTTYLQDLVVEFIGLLEWVWLLCPALLHSDQTCAALQVVAYPYTSALICEGPFTFT